jgi:hypothetical protein
LLTSTQPCIRRKETVAVKQKRRIRFDVGQALLQLIAQLGYYGAGESRFVGSDQQSPLLSWVGWDVDWIIREIGEGKGRVDQKRKDEGRE